ncbi:D-alanyl-D-alanine dipeptidase [Xanthomonas citri pv. fuscans]|nr:D-alanyl-D-alanine dipeptidase [Xanthomonas citri pv. fuscans]
MTDNLLFRNGRCWRQCVAQGVLLMSAVAPCALVAGQVHVSSARTAAEAGLVDVHALAPDIALDMRYASSNNFTGRVVPGYDAPRCYLLRPAADALARSADAQGRGLSATGVRLLSAGAVGEGIRYLGCGSAGSGDQAAVLPAGGQARTAGRLHCAHLRAQPWRDAGPGLAGVPAGRVPCSGHGHRIRFLRCAGAHRRARHQRSAAQRTHRQRLLQAMAAEGFTNYPMEWWHFTFRPEPTPETAYDVPVD